MGADSPSAHGTEERSMITDHDALYTRARTAYLAYAADANWTNHAGNPIPEWLELDADTITHWIAAVATIPVDDSQGHPCGTMIANLTVAVESIQSKLDVIGHQNNWMTEQVASFMQVIGMMQQRMNTNGGPLGLIAGMMRGGKSGD